MRALVFSDSHGDFNSMYNAIEKHNEIDTVIFLGDGIREFEDISELYPNKKLYSVSGNCDFMSIKTSTDILCTSKGNILYTHGDAFGVKNTLGKLILAAKERGARIALFGHTHEPFFEMRNEVYLFNPGSIGKRGSYGIIELLNNEIYASHYTM